MTVVEIMPPQSVMPFSIRRGNQRKFPLCSFTVVYLFSDLKYSRAVRMVVVSLQFIFFVKKKPLLHGIYLSLQLGFVCFLCACVALSL